MSSRRRRHRDRREDEIDAAQGKLGPEFDEEELVKDEGDVLTISEVHLLLKQAVEKERMEPSARDSTQMPVFKKCNEYCEMFSRIKEEETVRQVRQELMEYAYDEQYDEEGNLLAMDDDRLQLSRFEMAQLANLSIESVEEAKVLVPTLAPKDDAKLQSLLDELATKRKFQS